MLDKYLFLLLLIAANTAGKVSGELDLSFIQTTKEYTAEGLTEPSFETVSLLMKKQGESTWLIEDMNKKNTSILNISESEVMIKGENPILVEFDWVALNEFQLKETDTIFYSETNLPLLEIRSKKEQKLIEISVLDEHSAELMNHIEVHYKK